MPAERTLRDILNRRNYRLKRIQKGKPLKKTDAIFANVKQVQEQVRNDPKALEISMDTKAKVALGEYVRGEKPGMSLRGTQRLSGMLLKKLQRVTTHKRQQTH